MTRVARCVWFRVMADELTNSRAALQRQNREAQGAIQDLLSERDQFSRGMVLTHGYLQTSFYIPTSIILSIPLALLLSCLHLSLNVFIISLYSIKYVMVGLVHYLYVLYFERTVLCPRCLEELMVSLQWGRQQTYYPSTQGLTVGELASANQRLAHAISGHLLGNVGKSSGGASTTAHICNTPAEKMAEKVIWHIFMICI